MTLSDEWSGIDLALLVACGFASMLLASGISGGTLGLVLIIVLLLLLLLSAVSCIAAYAPVTGLTRRVGVGVRLLGPVAATVFTLVFWVMMNSIGTGWR